MLSIAGHGKHTVSARAIDNAVSYTHLDVYKRQELYSVYQAAKAISTGSRNITLALSLIHI